MLLTHIGSMSLWNTSDGKHLGNQKKRYNYFITTSCFLTEDRFVVGNNSGEMAVYEIGQETPVLNREFKNNATLSAIALTSKRKYMIVAADKQLLVVVPKTLKTKRVLCTLDSPISSLPEQPVGR